MKVVENLLIRLCDFWLTVLKEKFSITEEMCKKYLKLVKYKICSSIILAHSIVPHIFKLMCSGIYISQNSYNLREG